MNDYMNSINGNDKKITGKVCWESPANIALIKYWGKYPVQMPMNPSLSFVLRESVVSIGIKYCIDTGHGFKLNTLCFNGKSNIAFSTRIESYLRSMFPSFPFLEHAIISIDSHSTFPHSAGIASSAAAFSALALCLCSIEANLQEKPLYDEEFFKKASNIARLGSGSACRSLHDGMVLWGQTDKIPDSSDTHACKLDETRVHPIFRTLRDAILIVDDSKKAVSSSHGHALMQMHPFREERKKQAGQNLGKLLIALAGGNAKLFAEVVENEALTLHSLMMSSDPGYVLMKPNTITMLDSIRKFREKQAIDLCFTLDAGPNIHLLYFEKDKDLVMRFIQDELTPLCQNGRWIDDAMGEGPKMLKTD